MCKFNELQGQGKQNQHFGGEFLILKLIFYLSDDLILHIRVLPIDLVDIDL